MIALNVRKQPRFEDPSLKIMSFLSVLCMMCNIAYPQEMYMGVGVVLSTDRGILGKA